MNRINSVASLRPGIFTQPDTLPPLIAKETSLPALPIQRSTIFILDFSTISPVRHRVDDESSINLA